MTLHQDPHGSSYARAGLSWAIGGDLTQARRCLAELTPAQHVDMAAVLAALADINGQLQEQKTATGRRAMAAALLTPDGPELPDIPHGVEGYAIPGVHTKGTAS